MVAKRIAAYSSRVREERSKVKQTSLPGYAMLHPPSRSWQAEVTQVPTRQEKCGSTPWASAYSGKVSSSLLDLD